MQDAVETSRFDFTRFLHGETTAWGMIEDRFGRVRRKFTAQMVGRWNGDVFVLDEVFTFDDGEVESRTWQVSPGSNGSFTATCDDCEGRAIGSCSLDLISMRYRFKLRISGRTVSVDFDDRIHRAANGVALNRATIRKWGIRIAELWVVFVRNERLAPASAA